MPKNPFVPSIDELSSDVHSLLQEVELHNETEFSIHVIESLDPRSQLALSVTARVFEESFDNGPDLLRDEYIEYLPSMLHIVAMDARKEIPIGSIGLIRTPAAELKTIVDLAKDPWSYPIEQSLIDLELKSTSKKGWDIATLAVLPEYRKTKTSIAMLHALEVLSLQAEITIWTAILDDVVLRWINLICGGIFMPIGSTVSKPYLGSPASTAVASAVLTVDAQIPEMAIMNGESLGRKFSFSNQLQELRSSFGLNNEVISLTDLPQPS